MRGLAIPDETVDFVAETLAQHPNDGFVMRTAHLAGPLLDIVLQKSHWDTSEYIAVQSFPLWLGVPYKKALALGHTVGELLFLFGHGVAVALVDSRGRGVAFRVTGTDGFFVASEIIELAPSGKTL
jgi:hypothetical protein